MTHTIEINKNAPLYSNCKTMGESVNKAFYMAIHEGDWDAIKWLYDNVKGIRETEFKDVYSY